MFLSSNISPATIETIQTSAQNELEDEIDDININIDNLSLHRKMYSCEGGGIYLLCKTTTGCVLTSQCLYDSKDKKANIGRECVKTLLYECYNKICFDSYIQDQVLIFMGLAKGHSKILVGKITDHTNTCIDIIQQMLNIKFKITNISETQNYIECDGKGFTI